MLLANWEVLLYYIIVLRKLVARQINEKLVVGKSCHTINTNQTKTISICEISF